MPIKYEIDPSRGLILTTAEGVLTDSDVIEHKKRLIADPAFRPGMLELSDVRDVTQLDVTPEGVRMFTSFDRAHDDRPGRLAIVASEDFVFGMARMYQMSGTDDSSVGVFRGVEEAKEWLGVDGA